MARKGIKIQQGIEQQQVSIEKKAPGTGIGKYRDMGYTQLRREARARGIVSWRRPRAQVEADLAALDGV